VAAVVGGGAYGTAPAAAPRPPNPAVPNDRITGTGPVAFAGVLTDARMLTVSVGYDELSTLPTSCFVMMGTSPFISRVVLNTSHVTLGVCLGVRP
jgi:hypothetical protein